MIGNDKATKRELAEAVRRISQSSVPDMNGFSQAVAALGELLSIWTGLEVRVRISADGQDDGIDMVKRPGASGAAH